MRAELSMPRMAGVAMLLLGAGLAAGCGVGTPALPALLEAESLPGESELSGPVTVEVARTAGEAASAAVAEPAASPADDVGGPLRVMSFNVRFRNMLDLANNWPHRRDLFIATVRRFDPDVLGTQEVRLSQRHEIDAALPEYGSFGVGRVDGGEQGEMCVIYYRESRFRKLDGGHFWLSRQPDQPGSRAWLEPLPRMVTWVKLEPRHGAEPFYFFNTHFAAFSPWARRNSAELMRRRVERITNGAPAILVGDFNAGEGSRTHRLMRQGPDGEGRWFHDTYRSAHPEPAADENTMHGFEGTTEGRRIDWILASDDFDTLAAAIDRTHHNGRYPSDHFPVVAVLLRSEEAEGEPALAETRRGAEEGEEPDES